MKFETLITMLDFFKPSPFMFVGSHPELDKVMQERGFTKIDVKEYSEKEPYRALCLSIFRLEPVYMTVTQEDIEWMTEHQFFNDPLLHGRLTKITIG